MTILTGHFTKVSAGGWPTAVAPFGSWSAVAAAALGDTLWVNRTTGGLYFVATTPGVTGLTPPTWPTTPQGATVTDGSVVWTLANLLPSGMQGFDQRAMQAVNGDDGGTWAPIDPITFTGSTYGLKATVPTVIWGSSGYLETLGTGRFWITDATSYPVLGPTHSGRTRTLRSSFLTARTFPWAQWHPHIGATGALDGMMQTATRATQAYNASYPTPTTIVAPIEVHDQSTLASVTISFAVPTQPATVPTMPKARVVRVDVNGDTVVLTSVAAGADANGYVSVPAPSSAAVYFNNGMPQSWTLQCDQNNAINNALYTYEVQVIEEQNGTVTPILQPVDLVTNGTFQLEGPATDTPIDVDGVAPAVGMRVLYKDQPINEQNGIYVINGDGSGTPGAYGVATRAPDMPALAALPAGLQIPVKAGGAVLGLALYSLAQGASVAYTNYTAWPGSTIVVAVGTVVVPGNTFGVPIPNGFIYRCTTAGTTGASPPVWPTMTGTTVVDGSVTWTAYADTAEPLFFEIMGKTTPTLPAVWKASTSYNTGAVVAPTVPNGFVFAMFEAGPLTSGSTEPSWNTAAGIKTTDSSITWWAFAAPAFQPATPAGNIWNDIAVVCETIGTLRFQ